MLLTGSEDELCGLLLALFQAAAYHPPAVGPSAFPVFVYCKFMQRSVPWPSLLFQCTFSNSAPSAVCSFSVLCLLFSFLFFCEVGVSLSRSLCWVIPGVVVGISHDTWCSPVGLRNVSQAGLESTSGEPGALLFSQRNVAWRSFVQAGGSVCHSYDSSCCFFSAKCSSIISARFLIYGPYTVCFSTLVAILMMSIFLNSYILSHLLSVGILCSCEFQSFLMSPIQ
jgi:hypothetical protein